MIRQDEYKIFYLVKLVIKGNAYSMIREDVTDSAVPSIKMSNGSLKTCIGFPRRYPSIIYVISIAIFAPVVTVTRIHWFYHIKIKLKF